ncbi:hypothetical protein GCM10010411_72710 [Actinomadura fulvescens]|uniref:Uncharacterized protein n=1 Tax=Actinomadura fulvescens TaxID=46160 RepID=A0ABN3QG11_9ACTN
MYVRPLTDVRRLTFRPALALRHPAADAVRLAAPRRTAPHIHQRLRRVVATVRCPW